MDTVMDTATATATATATTITITTDIITTTDTMVADTVTDTMVADTLVAYGTRIAAHMSTRMAIHAILLDNSFIHLQDDRCAVKRYQEK